MVICLERGADLHTAQLMPLPLTISSFSKIKIGFTFLVLAHPGSPGQRVRALSSHSSVLRVYECFVRNCNFILFMSGLPRLCYRLAALASYSFLCSFSRIAVFGVGHFPWIIWFYSEYSVSLIPVFLLTLHTSASGHLCQFMSIYYYRCPALHQSVSHLPHSAFVLQILPFVD